MAFRVAGVTQTHSAVTINATASGCGPWMEVSPGVNFNVFWVIATASTTPHLGVFLDYTPLSSTISQTSTDTSLYVTATLSADSTTKTAMQKVSSWPAELNQPFLQCRLRFTGTGSNGTDTAVSAYFVQWN